MGAFVTGDFVMGDFVMGAFVMGDFFMGDFDPVPMEWYSQTPRNCLKLQQRNLRSERTFSGSHVSKFGGLRAKRPPICGHDVLYFMIKYL